MLVGTVVGAGARKLRQHRRQAASSGAMSTTPTSMTVIAIRSPGGPEMLVPEERPVPQPGPGEVLVKVMAAGGNRPDVVPRTGLDPPAAGATDHQRLGI